MKSLFRFFIDRPLLVNLLAVVLVVVGFLAFSRMRREGYPRVDMREVTVTTVYPGASPEDVELNVTIPIEEKLKGVTGIKEFSSSSLENLSLITIRIEPDVSDMEKVKQDIRRAIDTVRDMPAEVKDRPEIFEVKVQNFPVIEVALSSDRLGEAELVERARLLKKKLQDLAPVSRVDTTGIRDREVLIKADLDRMRANYLSFSDLIHALRGQNINLAGGNLESYLSEKGIITVSRFENLDDVRNVILRSNFEGRKVLLRDVASIGEGYERRTHRIRYNGRDGVSLTVVKKENADIIRTVDEVRALVAEFGKTPIAADLQIDFLNDDSEETRNKLSIVTSNALLGLALVIVVLFVFLNRRAALWTAIGLPIAIFMAAIMMLVADVSLNTISLSGIIIVLGMVVDDAIIIAENTVRLRRGGLSWREAALEGVHRVSLPVIATILTTIIAFLPILFMEGVIGDFSYEIPLVISFTLIASLLEAFFILPQHLAHTRRNSQAAVYDEAPEEERRIVRWLESLYKPLLRRALARRKLLVAGFVLLLVLALGYAFTGMKFVMFDEDQARIFWLEGETEPGSSLEKTSDEVRKIEAALQGQPAGIIQSFKSQVGLSIWQGSEDSNHFTMIVYLTPANTRTLRAAEIIADLREKVKTIEGIRKISFHIEAGGPPVGKPVEVYVIGNDDTQRLAALAEIRSNLAAIPGIHEIEDTHKTGKEELRIRLDYETIARYGLTPIEVAETIRIAFNGVIVTWQQTQEERIGYRIQLDDRFRRNRATLEALEVPNQERRLVPIRGLLRVSESHTLKRILHFNGDRTVNVSANIDGTKTTPLEVFDRLRHDTRHLDDKYGSVRIQLRGEAMESQKLLDSFSTAFAVAVLLIYFLLVLLFNSFSQPFLVLAAVPFGLIGVIVAFALHGMHFSLMGLLGIVGLSGVVVNDSIVLLDLVNRMKKEDDGGDRIERLVEGCRTRLRPILLTTLTTAAGLLPTAYGIGGYDAAIGPMVMAIAWGLVFATVLVLFLVPALYLLEGDLRHFLARLAGRLPFRRNVSPLLATGPSPDPAPPLRAPAPRRSGTARKTPSRRNPR